MDANTYVELPLASPRSIAQAETGICIGGGGELFYPLRAYFSNNETTFTSNTKNPLKKHRVNRKFQVALLNGFNFHGLVAQIDRRISSKNFAVSYALCLRMLSEKCSVPAFDEHSGAGHMTADVVESVNQFYSLHQCSFENYTRAAAYYMEFGTAKRSVFKIPEVILGTSPLDTIAISCIPGKSMPGGLPLDQRYVWLNRDDTRCVLFAAEGQSFFFYDPFYGIAVTCTYTTQGKMLEMKHFESFYHELYHNYLNKNCVDLQVLTPESLVFSKPLVSGKLKLT